mgnify:CR=1 FL=1|tara:strand:- start:2289 stop:3506 length:1218 start_codon:yes stop_codon:yes gene_type:complete
MTHRNFLQIFFILLSVFSLIKLYDHAINLETFQYGEWLINYQHGFVRRGLVGEIIYLFSSLFNNNIQLAFFIITSIFCLVYYFLNYSLIKKVKFNFIYYFIIFSPLFYIFFVVISKVGVRKEIILFIFYLLYLNHLSSNNFKLKQNWKFIFIFPILLFIHEGIFFYIPYIILPLFFIINKNDLKTLIFQTIGLVFFSSIIIILLYFNKGSSDHTLHICQSLGNYAPLKCDWWGPIAALGIEPLRNIENKPLLFFYLSADYKTWLGFLFYIFYGFIPIFLFLFLAKIKCEELLIKRKLFFLIYFLVIGFSLPLFHVAEDWSRWFSIHFHLLAFLIFFLQNRNLVTFKNNFDNNKINNFLVNKKIKKIFIVLLLFYGTCFHHHHFFFKDVKLELTYYKIFKNIKNNF